MPQQNRATLKTFFETGDRPTQGQFADLIDSAYNPLEDGAPFSGAWADLTGVPATFPPSAHSHVIGDVTGLQTALDGRAPLSHVHAIADVTGLQAALDGRALTSHTHALSALTQSGATTGQVPVWNGTAWAPADQSGGGSFDIANMAATWNAAGTTFSAIRMDVTDTASAAGSMLLDLRVDGEARFQVNKSGALTIGTTGFASSNTQVAAGGISVQNGVPGGAYNTGAFFAASSQFNGAANEGRVGISRGAALRFSTSNAMANERVGPRLVAENATSILALEGHTTGQTFNVYNTRTDAANHERLRIGWDANVVQIRPEAAGTGTVRVLHISGIPTSNPGPGILWNDAGTVRVGT